MAAVVSDSGECPGPEDSGEGQQLMLGKTGSSEHAWEDAPIGAPPAADATAPKHPRNRRSSVKRLSSLFTKGTSAGGASPRQTPNASASAKEPATTTGEHSEHKDRHSEARQAIARFKTTASETWNKVGSNAAKGRAWVWEASKSTAQATADGLKKLKIFGSPLDLLCKQESTTRPVPRLVLVCCTAIVSGDLSTKGIFRDQGSMELIEAVADHLYLGHGAVLPPSGASIHVLSGVLKQYLSNLQDPLLTYRLAHEWIAAGQEPIRGKLLAQQLPLPNANAFDLIIDTCHTISGHSEENEMDARALAEVLVPILLWLPPQKYAPKSATKPSQHGLMSRFFIGKDRKPKVTEDEDYSVVHLSDSASASNTSPRSNSPHSSLDSLNRIPLQGGELEAVVCVITHLISEYKTT
eukprot:evm.model.scf_354.10 EVM.evm.TU.scf_354.10   scf_354:87645-91811(+)